MKVFVTTDTHFGHRSLAATLAERPNDFEARIVRNWQKMIAAEDMVIHLGDIVVGAPQDWSSFVPTLPGRKILVLGNHDRKSINWYLTRGIDFCCGTFTWDLFGVRILFSHEPCCDGQFDMNIHGHLHLGGHREYPCDARHYLLSIERTAYQPILLESIVKEWRKGR